jgi:hypothetical protein
MKSNKTKDGDKPNAEGEHGESRRRQRVVKPTKAVKGKKGAKDEEAGPTAE